MQRSQFPGPSQTESIDDDVTFYAVALDGYNGLEKVEVMNSDDCKPFHSTQARHQLFFLHPSFS